MRQFIKEGTESNAAGGDPIQTAYRKINTMTEELYGDVGGASWGDIDGTLSDQSDLQTALDNKLSASQGAAVADSEATDVATLVADFNGLLASLRAAGIISG